jgi:hypothetical protein
VPIGARQITAVLHECRLAGLDTDPTDAVRLDRAGRPRFQPGSSVTKISRLPSLDLYRRRQQSATVRATWDEAIAEPLGDLEMAARERAMSGSARLMVSLLRAYIAETSREASRSVATRAEGHPVEVPARTRDDCERSVLAELVREKVAMWAAKGAKDG